ncbi:MAG: GntR family transcriptional regulator [Rhodospirillaceae bacterium]|nr:GntR family transcriptional regulator [Rhodospirillaceae bacterium]
MNLIAPADAHQAINENLAVPLYHQVYLVLRENILSGAYGPDRPLPTENDLCRTFGVSRITVKRAMRMLADEGLVTRHRGRGTFVAQKDFPAPRRNALDDLLQTVRDIGASTEVRRVGGGPLPASPEAAEKLGCRPGETVHLIEQVRMLSGEPIALIHAYVPVRIAARLRDKDSAALPVLAQLHAAGVPIERADQAVGATLADPATADRLGVDVGAPLIRVTRVVFDDTQAPVEWLVALYRGDRYEIHSTLSRDGLAGGARAPIVSATR